MSFKTPSLCERKSVRLLLEKRLDSFLKGYRQNIALIGKAGLGKTHLLNLVHRTLLSDHPDFIPVRLHAGFLSFEQFVDKWTAALICASMQGTEPLWGGEEVGEDAMSSRIPITFEKIVSIRKAVEKGEHGAAVVRDLFSLAAVLAHELQKKIVFMIEEFDAIEHLPVQDPFALLGKEIMVHKEVLFIVTSSRYEKTREIFDEKLSLLFGNFETVSIEPLGFAELELYMREQKWPFQLSRFQKIFLMQLTEGVPAYLDVLFDRLNDLCPVRSLEMEETQTRLREIPNERLMMAIEKELFDKRGRLFLLFEQKLMVCRKYAKDSSPYINTLLAIGTGARKLKSIAGAIQKPSVETKKILTRLVSDEMIQKYRVFFVIDDFLFQFWLLHVYQPQMAAAHPDTRLPKVRFLKHLHHLMDTLATQDREDYTRQLKHLLQRFSGDILEVGGKRISFPQFKEVVIKAKRKSGATLVAKNTKTRWVCRLLQQETTEEHIHGFLREARKYRRTSHKKILIHLADMDPNARLLAQEAKMVVWGLRDVNLLLQIYDLPKWFMTRGDCDFSLQREFRELFV